MKKYNCIKCGNLVYWHGTNNCFVCSLAVKTKGKECSVNGWVASNKNDELINIAKRQGVVN